MFVSLTVLLQLTTLAWSSEQTPPSAVTLETDKPLLRLQPPWKNCYMQFAEPLENIVFFQPSLFTEATTYPMCVCEVWWPENKFHQCVITSGQIAASWDKTLTDKCFPVEPTASCTDFEGNDDCVAHVYAGENNPDSSEFKSHTVLRCTDGSESSSQDPKWPVQVYKIDKFDIGKRCNKERLIEFFNYKFEKYRVGSQFYWQIPVLIDPTELRTAGVCDDRLISTSIKIYYKCVRTLPNMDNEELHTKPSYRTWKDTPPEHIPCYNMVGEPNEKFVIQGASKIAGQNGAKLCVCESETNQEGNVLLVSPSSKCPQYSAYTCNRERFSGDMNYMCVAGGNPSCRQSTCRKGYFREGGVLYLDRTYHIWLVCNNPAMKPRGYCPGTCYTVQKFGVLEGPDYQKGWKSDEEMDARMFQDLCGNSRDDNNYRGLVNNMYITR